LNFFYLSDILNIFTAFTNSINISNAPQLSYFKMLSNTLTAEWIKTKIMTYTVFSFKVVNAAVVHGDVGGVILPLGQVTGLIHDLPPSIGLI
jgi:hypothetical protein